MNDQHTEFPPAEGAASSAANAAAADAGPGATSGAGPVPARTFSKPNLVLKDPDPYAFANRIRRLTIVLAALCLLVSAPYLVRHFVYQVRYAQLRADVDVASEGLADVKSRLQDFTTASRLVAKRIGPSVVSIQIPGILGPEGQGSGVIVDESGYVVTNFHVIRQAVENQVSPRVFLVDGRSAEAGIAGVDPGIDLAVLKINLPNLIAAEWGDSDALAVGDLVWAAGSPYGLDSSITMGIVSAKERRGSSGVTDTAYQVYLQSDVAVNPGNSGGPLVNIEGKVVGVNTAIVGNTFRGISFALPASLAERQYETLIRDGWIERGYLGVSPREVPEMLRNRLKLDEDEGVLVFRVTPVGPARTAGLRQGDVILSWNGSEANDPDLLSNEIASTEVGSTAKVVVKRMGRDNRPVELTLAVKVGVSPSSIRPRGDR